MRHPNNTELKQRDLLQRAHQMEEAALNYELATLMERRGTDELKLDDCGAEEQTKVRELRARVQRKLAEIGKFGAELREACGVPPWAALTNAGKWVDPQRGGAELEVALEDGYLTGPERPIGDSNGD